MTTTPIKIQLDQHIIEADQIRIDNGSITYWDNYPNIGHDDCFYKTISGKVKNIVIKTNCPANIRPMHQKYTDRCGIWCTCRDGQIFFIETTTELVRSYIGQDEKDVGKQYFTIAFDIKHPHLFFDHTTYETLKAHREELLLAVEFLRNNAFKIELNMEFSLCL